MISRFLLFIMYTNEPRHEKTRSSVRPGPTKTGQFSIENVQELAIRDLRNQEIYYYIHAKRNKYSHGLLHSFSVSSFHICKKNRVSHDSTLI